MKQSSWRFGIFSLLVGTIVSSGSALAHYKVFVKGRCVDENRNPIAHAVVEVRDQWINPDDTWDANKITSALSTDKDIVGPLGTIGERLKQIVDLRVAQNRLLGTRTTNEDGSFGFEVSHGDWGVPYHPSTKPDLYARCLLETNEGWKVVRPDFPYTPYHAVSNTRKDSDASPYDVGEIKLPAKPALVFRMLRTAMKRTFDITGLTIVPALVLYPYQPAGLGRADTPGGTGFAGVLFITMAEGWEAESYIGHEFGHNFHIQNLFSLDEKGASRPGGAKPLPQIAERFRSVMGQLTSVVENMRNHAFEKKTDFFVAFLDGWASLMALIAAGPQGDFSFGFPKECIAICGQERFRKTRPDYCRMCDFANQFRPPNCRDLRRFEQGEEHEIAQVEGRVACRLWRLYEKWGFRPIWDAVSAAKATTWAEFYAEYKRRRPEADEVALLREKMIMSRPGAPSKAPYGFFVREDGVVYFSNGKNAFCAWGDMQRLRRERSGYVSATPTYSAFPAAMANHGDCSGGYFNKKPPSRGRGRPGGGVGG